MIDWRFIIPLALGTASIAACIVYLMAPPWQVRATKPLPPIPTEVVPNESARLPSEEEKALTDFEVAADAILRNAPDTRASTVTNMPSPAARIPLPRKRPAGAL